MGGNCIWEPRVYGWRMVHNEVSILCVCVHLCLCCSLRQLNSVNLLEPIRCVSVVLDHQTKLASHLLVGLERGKLIIVSVGDSTSDKS